MEDPDLIAIERQPGAGAGAEEAASTLAVVGGFLFSAIFVLSTVVVYIPQYVEIKRLWNAQGFSTMVSGILLVANISRIFFWFGKRFETTLLIQSIAVVVGQAALLELCVRVANAPRPAATLAGAALQAPSSPTGVAVVRRNGRSRKFMDLRLEDFWAWDDFESYLLALGSWALLLAVLSVLFINNPTFVELVGAVALSVEAMLGVPQFLRNYQHQSVEGLSTFLIFSWLGGDCFKAFYFVLNGAPAQFVGCAAFQILVDLAILVQIFFVYAHTRKEDK